MAILYQTHDECTFQSHNEPWIQSFYTMETQNHTLRDLKFQLYVKTHKNKCFYFYFEFNFRPSLKAITPTRLPMSSGWWKRSPWNQGWPKTTSQRPTIWHLGVDQWLEWCTLCGDFIIFEDNWCIILYMYIPVHTLDNAKSNWAWLYQLVCDM